MHSKNYLRVHEAVDEFNLTEPLVRKLIADGRLPSIRPAGARVVLIAREDLERVMQEGKRGGARG